MTSETPAALAARVDRAVAARNRLAGRAVRDVAVALAEAARRWQRDEVLAAELPERAALSRPMIAATLPLVAAALDADAMMALVERELHGAAYTAPALVGHVLASNVPALALPAIALAGLVGAAVVLKSGRRDPLSAPAFQRALATVDPELAATIVPVYWPGGDAALEEAAFARADVVVATGSDPTLACLGARSTRPLVRHGTRVSIVALAGDHVEHHAPAVARDIALYDQRGCLSPHAVYVAGDAGRFAAALHAALDALAARLPLGPASVEERGAVARLRGEAEWEGAAVLTGPGGTVIVDERPVLRTSCGRRTVRVHPLADAAALPSVLRGGGVECVGLAGAAPDVETLRALGVARVCAPGHMQEPPLSWPRGQQAPLRVLVGLPTPPQIQVEPS